MRPIRNSLLFMVLICVGSALQCGAQAPEFNTASAGVTASQIESAVSLLCKPGDTQRDKDGHISGCRKCPAGTDFHGETESNWEMYAETPGHFTSVQEDNLILSGTGCDSHAMNLGGSFVFSLKEGKARLLQYDKGLITDQCHKFAYPDGRNFLICRGGYTGQGETDESLSMVSFATNGKQVESYLIRTRDETGTCGNDGTTPVQASEIKNLQFEPSDSTSITKLTVTATLGTVPCSQASQHPKSGKIPPALKTYSIEFLFDGKSFHIAPASRTALNRFAEN